MNAILYCKCRYNYYPVSRRTLTFSSPMKPSLTGMLYCVGKLRCSSHAPMTTGNDNPSANLRCLSVMHRLSCCMALLFCVVGESSGCSWILLVPLLLPSVVAWMGSSFYTPLLYVRFSKKDFFSCPSCSFLFGFWICFVFHFLLLGGFCFLPCDCSTVSFHVLFSQSPHFFH